MRIPLATVAFFAVFFASCAFAQRTRELVQGVEPKYSDEARIAGLEGTVLVTGTVGEDGSMRDVRVSRSLGLGLDEQATAAAAQLRFQPGPAQAVSYPIEFAFPAKQSQWHLVRVDFKTPEGASRPTFAKADYPAGSGISVAAFDEARLLEVIGRGANATVSFDIDESGSPGNFQVVGASHEVWGPEAVELVKNWRFHASMRAGAPVSVPCTVSLVWGPEDFTSRAITNQVRQFYPAQSQGIPLPEFAIVSQTEPEYTDRARQAGIEGSLIVSLNVDREGTPQNVTAADAPLSAQGDGAGMGLVQNAVDAIREWRFAPPPLVNGETGARLMVQVNFKLSGVGSAIFTPPVPAAKKPPAR